MLNRLAPAAHGLGILIQPLLYSFELVLGRNELGAPIALAVRKFRPARTRKTAILLRSSSDFASGVEGESRQAGDDFQDRSKMLVDDGARADLVMRDQRIEQLPVLGKDDAEALRI